MAERFLLIAAVAALSIGLGFSEFARWSGREAAEQRESEITAELVETRNESKAALAAVIRPETILNADKSVYLVLINGHAGGTAFVVDRDRGILGTAAHVADTLPLENKLARVEILNQFTGDRIEVAAAQVHAGYGSFSKAVEAYQPVRNDTPLVSPRIVSVEETPFDAGVIVVDPIDADTGINKLGPNLPIAREETLLSLKAGDPIAVIGFPSDRVGSGQIGDSADSRAERGVIAAMIAPVDNTKIGHDPAIANLIIHRMATAAGNSGSPVLNSAGEVIGIHTHGVSGAESNGDGLAQRADMLKDLLEPLREETRLATLFRPAWEKRLEFWLKAEDVLPWSLHEYYTMDKKEDPRQMSEIDFKKDPPFKFKNRKAKLSESLPRFVSSPADLKEKGTPSKSGLNAVKKPTFVLSEKGQYFEAYFYINPKVDNLVYAFDYTVNNGNGICPLTAFWRKQGEAKLAVSRNAGTISIHIPAEKNEASRIHVIFKRSASCDRRSRDFLFGTMSWEPEKEEPQTPATPADPKTNAKSSVSQSHNRPEFFAVAVSQFKQTSSSLRQFVDCRIAVPGVLNKCARQEFIELSSVHVDEENTGLLELSADE